MTVANVNYTADFRGTRALAVAKKIDKALHKKRLKTQGSEITYRYDIRVQWMDDGSLAVELMDQDSGDFEHVTITIS